MAYRYSIATTEKQAKAVILNRPISTKHSIEVCAALRGLAADRAKLLLQGVIAKRQAIPFKRHMGDVGHRKGNMAAGRYPVKTAQAVLELLESASTNAQFKGLGANLIIRHIAAKQGPSTRRPGRRNVDAKRTHLEIVLEETKAAPRKEKEKAKEKKKTAKAKPEPETKAAVKQPTPPKTEPKPASPSPAEPAKTKTQPETEAKTP